MKIKIEIKNRFTGKILFEFTKESNTIKNTVEEAIKQKADISEADLSGANLYSANLESANLVRANLESANLVRANLYSANLYSANLYSANLESANLESANLESANLVRANLVRANLYSANLYSANLVRANLYSANLVRANLYSANLESANLESANLEKDKFPLHEFNFLPEGDIIGYKKVNGKIIKLLIPSSAKRVHSISARKCRAEFAKVLDIEGGYSEILNEKYNPHCLYKVGEIVKPDSFNDCWLTECGNGINFFVNRQEAIEY